MQAVSTAAARAPSTPETMYSSDASSLRSQLYNKCRCKY
jgi:hypothetical protein